MPSSRRLSRFAFAFAACSALTIGASLADDPPATGQRNVPMGKAMHGMTDGRPMSPGSQELHRMYMHGMQQMQQMELSGDADRDFATMMKHHHEQGRKMAEIEVKNGKSPEMRELAQKIIDAQQAEIRQLDAWLEKNRKAR